MISFESSELIVSQYEKLNNEVKRVHIKIAVALISFLIGITLFMGFGLFYAHPEVQRLVLTIGTILTLILILIAVNSFKNYAPSSPKYAVLYPAIYIALNMEKTLFKIDHDVSSHINIHQNSQLFNFGMRPYRIVKTQTKNNDNLTIYDMQIYRPTQRSSIKQFQGSYYRLQKSSPLTLQIRTQGKPSKGDYEFHKRKQIHQFGIFEGDPPIEESTLDKLLNNIQTLDQSFPFKAFYLSLTPNEIALALSPTQIPKFKPPIKHEDIIAMAKYFKSEREIFDILLDDIF